MLAVAKWIFLFVGVTLVALRSVDGQNERNYDPTTEDGQGRNFLDFIGLGTGPETDPYVARTNAACISGNLAECFKTHALNSFDEFFDKSVYQITDNARIVRMPTSQLRQLAHEPFEYSESPRSNEPEWDQLVKFAMRKVEKFLKSNAIEVEFNNDVTENGRYSPRFVDEIADEIDLIEDKKDSLFNRKQLKKLFIPMLIILKLFKLKLLLFLPLILGLASFKKFLSFLAIIIPGLIAFFKFCQPNLPSNFAQSSHFNYNTPHYSPTGIAYPIREQPYEDYNTGHRPYYGDNGVHFRDDNHAQQLAYNGWSQYRTNGNKEDIKADETENPTTKKSILPDS